MKLFKTLENQLKKENNFVTDDGELKKWVVLNKAQNFDARLIELLLDDKELKAKFFIEVGGALVFHQNLFVQFLEQKNYLNDSYTQYKNKVGLTIGGKYLKQRNEVALVWPFKDCILEGGQSREENKREEIFFNEILAQDEITQLLEPKVLTNAKVYDKDGEQDFKSFTRDTEINKKRGLPENTITDNLIIKGNNLLALHSLKKEFAGKVKLIYIDPPYNTGKDGFKYNDNFNHSTWLTFMKNRLTVARELLKDDGVIFVQCDDNEQAYLKVLMDEVFGRENFMNTVIRITTRRVKGDTKNINSIHDNLHIYGKNIFHAKVYHKEKKETENSIYNLTDKHINYRGKYLIRPLDNGTINYSKSLDYIVTAPDGEEIFAGGSFEERKERLSNIKNDKDWCFRWSKEKLKWGINNDYIVFKNIRGKQRVYFKIYQFVDNNLNKTKKYDNFLSVLDNCYNNKGTSEVKKIFKKNYFNYPKPEKLLYEIIEVFTKPDDIVLDYHLGSGTTTAVAHKMNRQYIGVEQMDYIETVAVERLKKVIGKNVKKDDELLESLEFDMGGISKAVNWQGGGAFTYLELKKHNQTFIEKIEQVKNSKALLEIWEQMKEKSFLNYNVDIQKQDERIEDFKQLELSQQKEHLVELLDKNQLYVNLSSINDKDFEVSKEEKQVTKEFYQFSINKK